MTHFGLRNFRSAWSMLSADLTDLDLTVQESCPLLESAFPLLTRAEGSERSHLNGRRQNKILPIFTDFRKGNKIALVKVRSPLQPLSSASKYRTVQVSVHQTPVQNEEFLNSLTCRMGPGPRLGKWAEFSGCCRLWDWIILLENTEEDAWLYPGEWYSQRECVCSL